MEPRVRLLLRTTERGLTSAIWAGIQAADTDAVSWMDCDLAMPPETIPLLLDRLNAGADIAIGSRYVRGGSDPGHGLMARAFSIVINTFASLLLGWGVRDYTSGFVAARREVFDKIRLHGRLRRVLHRSAGPSAADGVSRRRKCPTPAAPGFSGESKTGANVWDYLRKGWKYVTTVLDACVRALSTVCHLVAGEYVDDRRRPIL